MRRSRVSGNKGQGVVGGSLWVLACPILRHLYPLACGDDGCGEMGFQIYGNHKRHARTFAHAWGSLHPSALNSLTSWLPADDIRTSYGMFIKRKADPIIEQARGKEGSLWGRLSCTVL